MEEKGLKKVFTAIATVGPVGYLPVAPGTGGSLVAFLFCLLLEPEMPLLLVLTLIIFITGIWAAGAAEEVFGEKDSRKIVIDEVAGYLVSVFFIPPTLLNLTAAFFIFRAFDILKPPPIRYFEERIKGGLGVMFDDLLAGVYTNLLLQVFILLRG